MSASGEPLDRAMYETWTLLLNGWGFNWYRLDNQLQADDLLVRNRACGYLDDATAKLRAAEAAFRRRHLPPPTRAAPLPDPAKLRQAQEIGELRERLTAIETQIRGSAMPPDDRIQAGHRDHVQTLASLLEADTTLVGAAHEIAAALDAPDVEGLAGKCEPYIAWLLHALSQRRAMLDIRV